MEPIHQAAQQGFSQAAELYQQVRPNYPNDIVNWLKQDLALGPQSHVADLGSGTGKFLPYLSQVTSHLVAVEPVEAMLEQLKQAYPEVKTVQAHSTAIPLPSATLDAVICAQSFHWFSNMDTLSEIDRLLKTGGHLGLVWNQRDTGVDWVKALADLLAPLEGDTPRYHSEEWKKVFEGQSLFQFEGVKTFLQFQRGPVEQVVSKRLLSTSFIAAMPEAQQLELKHRFEQVVYELTGKQAHEEIEFPYITYAYNFRKIGSANRKE